MLGRFLGREARVQFNRELAILIADLGGDPAVVARRGTWAAIKSNSRGALRTGKRYSASKLSARAASSN